MGEEVAWWSGLLGNRLYGSEVGGSGSGLGGEVVDGLGDVVVGENCLLAVDIDCWFVAGRDCC